MGTIFSLPNYNVSLHRVNYVLDQNISPPPAQWYRKEEEEETGGVCDVRQLVGLKMMFILVQSGAKDLTSWAELCQYQCCCCVNAGGNYSTFYGHTQQPVVPDVKIINNNKSGNQVSTTRINLSGYPRRGVFSPTGPGQCSALTLVWLSGSWGGAASNKGLKMFVIQGSSSRPHGFSTVFAPKPGCWHAAQQLSGPPGADESLTDWFVQHRLSTTPPLMSASTLRTDLSWHLRGCETGIIDRVQSTQQTVETALSTLTLARWCECFLDFVHPLNWQDGWWAEWCVTWSPLFVTLLWILLGWFGDIIVRILQPPKPSCAPLWPECRYVTRRLVIPLDSLCVWLKHTTALWTPQKGKKSESANETEQLRSMNELTRAGPDVPHTFTELMTEHGTCS